MIGKTVSHYRILGKIGEGGMGVVYKAEDMRLDRVVALKFLAPEHTRDRAAKARFVQEAKAASALDHPNVCTIFEIDETDDGHLFIAMAYYAGDSVKDLIARGPLEMDGAVAIAQQAAQGLQQAHDRGIVHRDVKPGNILITGDGIVKVVDFGLAKLAGESRITQTGATVGTLSYMAPEQIQGEPSDHRADIWALGVTLYEAITGHLPFRGDHPQAIAYSIVNQEPIPVSDWVSGVAPELVRILGTCLKKTPAERYQNLADLSADLQAVARIVAPASARMADATLTDLTARLTVRPYPGLASFTEAETAYFHGRQSEVESAWDKLKRHAMLAIIGPSGAGKTSFLRAGFIPARSADWGVVMCTPGSSPFLALRQALVPELAGDTEAIRDLLGENYVEATVNAVSRWRRRHGDAVVILDQFEELFTLNPSGVQEQFAGLLGRLAREAGVHLLFSMRDDFLFHCAAHAGLAGVFDSPMPLRPLSGEALRRALTQPAKNLGYRFEDDGLADEMLAEVEGERGALPLLAFAISRLWEKRDREQRVLTRRAYEEIGGVGGALAQHAEATMDRIGADYQPIVRELFRNLVTAQVTRVARERDQLLSLFDKSQRDAAAGVLQELISARLLTSYELERDDAGDSRRVEIVHESLLSSWPRLVRWQTQDADSAQFHDQLRQAADLWDAKGRPEDLLWSGTLYNEFNVWRERYPGGLTDTEAGFCRAMTDRARQERRRRMGVVAGVFVALVAVLVAVTSLWKRSEVSERKALAEARKAEANYLASLSREAADTDPTSAVAYAMASLERDDTPEVRQLALENMAEAPLRFEFPRKPGWKNPLALDVAPDGKFFVVGWAYNGVVTVHHADGDSVLEISAHTGLVTQVQISPSGRRLVTAGTDSTVCVWSLPDGKLVRRIRREGEPCGFCTPDDKRLITSTFNLGRRQVWQSWPLPDGEPTLLGREGARLDNSDREYPQVSPDFRWVVDYVDKEVFLFPLDDLGGSRWRRVGAHDYPVMYAQLDRRGRQLASADLEGWVRVWDITVEPSTLEREFKCPGGDVNRLRFDMEGRHLVSAWNGGIPRVWDLDGPTDARPLELKGHTHWAHDAQFMPGTPWLLSTGNGTGVAAWPLTRALPLVLENRERYGQLSAFLPDGNSLISIGVEGAVWFVPLTSSQVASPRLLMPGRKWAPTGIAVDPSGRYAGLCSHYSGQAYLVSIEDGRFQQLEGAPVNTFLAQFSADSRLVVMMGWSSMDNVPPPGPLCAWDVRTGKQVTIGPRDKSIEGFRMAPDGRLVLFYDNSVWSWDLATGNHELIRDGIEHDAGVGNPEILPSGRRLLYMNKRGYYLLDLETGESILVREPIPGGLLGWAVNREETVIAMSNWKQKTIEIHSLRGDDPYVLYDEAYGIDFDPKGRYVAASNTDGQLRLWSIPAGRPVYSLPHDEFLNYLHSQTNARAVRDTTSASGVRVSYELFPGWSVAPLR